MSFILIIYKALNQLYLLFLDLSLFIIYFIWRNTIFPLPLSSSTLPTLQPIKRKEEEGWSVRRLEVDKGRGAHAGSWLKKIAGSWESRTGYLCFLLSRYLLFLSFLSSQPGKQSLGWDEEGEGKGIARGKKERAWKQETEGCHGCCSWRKSCQLQILLQQPCNTFSLLVHALTNCTGPQILDS